jgi:hypothetical protein
MCPFLAVALMKGIPQVPVVSDEGVPPEVACCREKCQWWQGGKCAMAAIAERLQKVDAYLGHLHAEGDTA